MNIDFSDIIVYQDYNRKYLAEKWGYESFHAIAKGAVTPQNTNLIIFFITKEKQKVLTQYKDDLYLGILSIEGETNHGSDYKIINSKDKYDMHLFYRDHHHKDFTYYGLIYLKDYVENNSSPSNFTFYVPSDLPDKNLVTEINTHGNDTFENFESEGKLSFHIHRVYERNRKNRALSIKIHGTSCMACGFNFNDFYGNDLSNDFVEIHHIKSITEGEREVNPKNDLIPLCSNCHSMAHRQKDRILTLNEIKESIRKNKI